MLRGFSPLDNYSNKLGVSTLQAIGCIYPKNMGRCSNWLGGKVLLSGVDTLKNEGRCSGGDFGTSRNYGVFTLKSMGRYSKNVLNLGIVRVYLP